ncbi:MAG: pseudouridine synthase [Rhodobacteraceae bacterium]|nr:MAG: pseudouridine synthase [Paracoccaceae bacterium]
MQRENNNNQRLSKKIARSGFSSRREAEKYIESGRVKVNGAIIKELSFQVGINDQIHIDGRRINKEAKTRLWKFHKPKGLITSHKDEKSRQTIFQILPKNLPRLITVGRLDLNSEGLLLLTNDGDLKRKLELPSSKIVRSYRVRAKGVANENKLSRLRQGITVDGIRYRPMELNIIKQNTSNVWLSVRLMEGKNREIRLSFQAIGLQVNKLIRTSFGSISLGKLDKGQIEEVELDSFSAILKDD